MKISSTSLRLLALFTSTLFCGCSSAGELAGLWRKELANTNGVVAYETVEFLTNGSFKWHGVIQQKGGRETRLPITGNYTVIDTNHLRFEFSTNSIRRDFANPLTLSFSVLGDQLELPGFTPSTTNKVTKYRKQKQ